MVQDLRGAALVTVGGRVELEIAAGPADAEHGSLSTPQTRFQIASVSKQFVAAAHLLLADCGVVDLDASIDQWFPRCSPSWRAIKLRHLLTHTSGLGHWSEAPGFDPFEPLTPDERVRLLQRAPLHADPGTRWTYSSPAYLVAARIVEQAAGQPYAAFVSEHIFAPLGMDSTVSGYPPAGVEAARGHRDGQLAPAHDFTSIPGTGDVWSTVGDLARYLTSIYSGRLLSSESLRALTTAHVAVDQPQGQDDQWVVGASYGYGLFVGTIARHRAYFHSGDVPGFRSFSAWFPDHQACLVILANDEAINIEHCLRQLLPESLKP